MFDYNKCYGPNPTSRLVDESHRATYILAICISIEISMQGDLHAMPPTSVDPLFLLFVFGCFRFGTALRLEEIASISLLSRIMFFSSYDVKALPSPSEG